MTAVVAIRVNIDGLNKVVVASDSQFSRGYSVENHADRAKIIAFPFGVVGMCGFASMQLVLERVATRDRAYMKMEDKHDALNLALESFETFKKRLERMGTLEHNSTSCQLLIATTQKLFVADKYAFVSTFDDWTSIGCGEELVNGAMAVLYPTIKTEQDLADAAVKAIEIACEQNSGCSLPVQYVILEEEPVKKAGKESGRKKSKSRVRKK